VSSEALSIGQWGMFGGPEGKQLIILDGQPCGPVSARKLLEEIPRRLLLDEGRVTQAMIAERPDTAEVVTHASQELRVETRQIVSPWSKTVVGVFAGVWPVNVESPEPPLVGSWEWVVAMKDGEITGRRTFWTKSLFDLYEVDSAVARASGYWEVDVWAGQLVAEQDQLRFFTSLRDGYWDDWTGVRCATFDAIAGYGTSERRTKHLRLVASKGQMSTEESLVFQGFSYEVPEVFNDRALAEEYPTDDAFTGLMGLVKDPMAIVDPNSLEVLVSTKAWRREALGDARSLREVVDADPDDVRRFLINAADRGSRVSTGRVQVTSGPQKHYDVSVIGMDRGPGRDALAVVLLSA
jgi:hypothetical protein